MRPLLALFLVGCTTVSEPFRETVDADGFSVLSVETERGNLVYGVGSDEQFVIDGTSIGRGGGASGAASREAGNSWVVQPTAPELRVEAQSDFARGAVDFDIRGPSLLDVDLTTFDGSVTASEVEGEHNLVGGRIQTVRLRGSATVASEFGGVDIELYPFTDGFLDLTATGGDVVVRLPYGGNYDVEIVGDPEHDMYVTELGFGASVAQPGYFSGIVGDGSIRVRIQAQGGSVELVEAF